LEKIIVYTDGACSGNPGRGGWANIIVDTQYCVQENGAGEASTTNNRMELMGALDALEKVNSMKGLCAFYIDSLYVLRGITQWSWGWKKRGWKTAEGEEVSNQDLWKLILQLVEKRGAKTFEWNYCRGHAGHAGNERCDEIAVAFSQGENPYLYEGPLKDYSHDVMRLPPSEPWPEMKSPSEKLPPYSYLSFANGVVARHKDWASCERTVKGKSGVKFKKSKSAADEQEILKSWGLPAGTKIVDGN
jgi:ribonuclease HI